MTRPMWLLTAAVLAAPETRPDRYTVLSAVELTPERVGELTHQAFG